MSIIITSVHLKAVVQVSDTRMSSLGKAPRPVRENLLKSMIVLGEKARFVIGWTGYATPDVGQSSDTRDWLFNALREMNAPWLTAEEIMHVLSGQATAHFSAFSSKDDKRTNFVLAGWEVLASGESPFVGLISNYVIGRNEMRSDEDPRHHIPTFQESATAGPAFKGWVERFRSITDRHYVVNVMGDCKPAKLQQGFRGLEGLLKQQASAERVGAACRQIVWEAAQHSSTIGRNLITVEMDSAGKCRCSYHPEHSDNVVLQPDCLSTEGCYTRTTITQIAEGKIRISGKIAKAVANNQ